MATRQGRVSGSKIRELRERRRLLQHDLAQRLRERGYGTTQTTVSRWESGQEPRAHILPALAAELGCEIEELFGDDDEEEADLSSLLSSTSLADALRALAVLASRERR